MRQWLAKRVVRIVIAAVVVTAIAGTSAAYFWPSNALPSGAAFRVDGQTVTVSQLQAWVSSMKGLYGVQVPSSTADQAKFWRSAAKAMAVETAVSKAADRLGVTVSEQQAADTLAQYVASVYGSGANGQSAFASALMTAGTSLAAVQAEFRRVLTDQALMNKVIGAPTKPTDAQIQAGYTRWACHLGTPESRHIQNIVVLDATTAATVKSKLASGVPWKDAVRRWSRDSTSATKGGDIGWQTADSLEPAFAKAAFAASPGVVFGPVQTSAGYDIGRVVKIRPAVLATRASSATQVVRWLESEQQSQQWASWVAKQTASADARYASAYQPGASTDAIAPGSSAAGAVPANCSAK